NDSHNPASRRFCQAANRAGSAALKSAPAFSYWSALRGDFTCMKQIGRDYLNRMPCRFRRLWWNSLRFWRVAHIAEALGRLEGIRRQRLQLNPVDPRFGQ